MRKFYASFIRLLPVFALLSAIPVSAQITVRTPVPSSTVVNSTSVDGAIVFGLKNTNATAITITQVSTYVQNGLSGAYSLWYHTTVTGAPTQITAANGWVQIASVSNYTSSSDNVQPVFTGLSFSVPANTTYRLALAAPVNGPTYGTAYSQPNKVAAGGVELYIQDNPNSPGYGGNYSTGAPGNTPRGFFGAITFTPGTACTTPVGGTATATRSVVCIGGSAGVSSAGLNVTGSSVGTGQTYQWQSSATETGTYIDFGSSSADPSLVITPAATLWYRVAITCGGNTAYSQPVQVAAVSVLNASNTYTIDNTQPTGGNNFKSFTDALFALSCGVTGNVIFNVTAGQTFTEDIPVITYSGTAANNISFKKSGVGANPKIIPASGGSVASSATIRAHGDGIIVIYGGDYITFDGIDLQTNPSFSGSGMYEYGFYLKKSSATNACKNITIKNCNITLNKAALYSFGIYVSNIQTTGEIVITSVGGASENIKISNNTISNSYGGVLVAGGSDAAYYDQNIEIGVDGGNTITGYAGGASIGYGIYAIYQNNLKVANNTVTSGTGTTTTLYGIFLSTGTNSNIDVYGNNVTVHGGGTTTTIYGISNAMGGTGTSNQVNVYNNTVTGCTYTTATSGDIQAIVNSASAYKAYIYGNTVSNNTLSCTTTGIFYGIYQSGAVVNESKVYNNIVINNNKATGTTGSIYGINHSPATTATSYVYGNTVSGLSSTGTTSGTVFGIAQTAGGTTNIYNNKVFDVTTNSTGGSVYGISVTSGTINNVYNNFISDLKAPTVSATADAVRGINVNYTTASTSINLYYNTVYLNATSSGANFSTSGIYHTTSATATSAALTMQNNNVVNLSTPNGTGKTSAFRRSSTTLTNFASANNNNYYAGTPGTSNVIFYDGTNFDQDLAAYKSRVSTKESSSISELPPFVDVSTIPYNLHIQTTIVTQLESGGVAVGGIATDYDGDTRSGTPDIGADEFAGLGSDITGPAITYTALANTICTDNRTLTATIVDASNVNVSAGTKPRLWYKKQSENNSLGANTSAFNGWKYVEASNASSPFIFTLDYSLLASPISGGDIIEYFVIAQDLAGTPNIGNNTATFNSAPTSVALSASVLPISAPRQFEVVSQPPIAVKANKTDVCASGNVTLDLDGITLPGGTYQWQSTPTGTTAWADISGATTIPYTTGTITTSTDFRLVVKCGGTPISTSPSNIVTLTVNNPQISSVTNGVRCGVGTVDLNASSSSSTINWYAAASGGTALGTGNTFTTPTISSTTTYYAAASDGGSQMNVASPTIGSSVFITTTPGWGLRFTVNNTPATINTVTVRAQGSTAGPASIQIKITDLSDVILYTGTLHNFTVATALADYIIPVNVTVPPGNYKMGMTYTGLSNMVRESSGVTFPYTTPGNEVSITAGANGAGTAQTTTAYYWFYNWVVSTGCEGARVPVTATVNTAPALTVTASKTICNNVVHALTVTSTIGDFNSYVWTPQTDLYTDAAATIPYTGSSAATVYVKATTSAAVIYTLTAQNSTTLCANTATTTVTTLPDPTISSSVPSICTSGSALLSLNPASTYGGNAGLQWQSSANGTVYNDISGANSTTYNTGTITQTTYYKLILKDQAGVTCSQPTITMVVNTPQVTGTTGGSRCGVGTVDLNATTSGSGLNWYASASGGTALGTGNIFTTPVISTTTTYYVSANDGGSVANVGLASPPGNTGTSGAGQTTYGLYFDALSSFTLQTVDVYPIHATAGTPGSVTIAVINSAGTILHQATVNVVGYPTSAIVPQTVTLNFNIAPGTGYRLVPMNRAGVTGLLFQPSASAPGGNYGYPFTVPGVVSITSGTYTGNVFLDLYYYFYNWQISTGCEGARVPVTATVNTPPALTATAGKTICNNATQMLAVTSNLADFNSYVWSPQTDLYTDAAATIPYTGASATQVYLKSATAGSTAYTITSNNSTTQCANTATSTIVVMPDPTITSSTPEICISGSSTLSLSPSTGYGAGTLQWQNSGNGISYNDIGGATSNSYVTPTLTQSTYYKLVLKDQAGATCSQPTLTITVNNPQVVSTTPASRCGAGTVTLGATASGLSTLNWYMTSSGGSSISTGQTFITPSISSSTTYYVSASTGGGGISSLGRTNRTDMTANTNNNSGLIFSAPTGGLLQSVSVYPSGTGAGTLTIVLKTGNTAGATVIATTTVNLTGVAIGSSTKTVVPLNFTVPPGTNYYLSAETFSGGLTGLGRELTGGGPFPYTSPTSDWQITASWLTTGAPSTTTHYYYFYDWVVVQGCESSRTAVVATVNTPASNAAGVTGGSSECATATISGSTEFNYTDCDRIAIVTPTGGSAVSGNVNACVKIDASVQTAPTTEPYVQRHYDITPATNPNTATSIITLYYLQSEFNAFNTANGTYPDLPANSGDAAGKANLRITQYRGTGTAPGNYTGTASYIDPADVNIVWNSTDNRWEVSFSATGGGGFYVHTGNSVLPVTIVDFRGERVGTINKLSWNTSTEVNNAGFEVERSADGRSFSKITFINSKADNGNSTAPLSYSYNDERPLSGNNYYRLKQIDKDGRSSYSNVVLLRSKATEITLSSVYPNPARDEVNLVITSPSAEKITIVVTDLTGKVIMQQPAQLVMGDNQQQLNIAALASGTYIIKAVCSSGCETAVHRFVKQ